MADGSAVSDAEPLYRVVRTSRLYEQIVQQVEDSILKGRLKPGDQLPAERHWATLQVGRVRPQVRAKWRFSRRLGNARVPDRGAW